MKGMTRYADSFSLGLPSMNPLVSYTLVRLSLIPVTLLFIFLINFAVITTMPGGPVDQILAQAQFGQVGGGLDDNLIQVGEDSDVGGQGLGANSNQDASGQPRGSQSFNDQQIELLKQRYGLDQPLHVMFFRTLWRYVRFDFGESAQKSRPVVDLIIERMPVMLGLGIVTFILSQAINFGFGIAKAYRQNSRFDTWTTSGFIALDAIPNLILAIVLIALLSKAGPFFSETGLIPHKGLVSENFDELSWGGKIADYLWHLAAPAIVILVGSYASGTNFLRNAYADQLSQTYVMTARAKGLNERQVFWRHVFRNGGILVIPTIPAALVGVLFFSSVLIESIFRINGLGLLSLEALANRDFPVFLAVTWIFSLMGLVFALISDLMLVAVDPRINFSSLKARS